MALGTALLWGAMSPIAKVIASYGVSQITVMSYRAVVIVLITGAWLLFSKGKRFFCIKKELFFWYGVIGILALVFNASGFMMSSVYLSVPNALMLHYTFPLVTMAGSIIITKERPTLGQIFSGFLVLLGLYIGFVTSYQGESLISRIGLAWGILSVLGLSGQTLITRRLLQLGEGDPLSQLFFSHLLGGVALIILKSLISGWSDLGNVTPSLMFIIQYPAFFSGLLGHGLLYASLKNISASASSLICSLEIVFALLFAFFLLSQIPTLNELLGCFIILFSVVFSVGKEKTT